MKSYLRFLSRNKRYTAIQVVGLSVSLAFMIVLIAILGLIGMSIYYADESTHETAVRKVFGGTIKSKTRRTLWSFLKVTLIANIVAVPVTVYLVTKQAWFDLATIPGWGGTSLLRHSCQSPSPPSPSSGRPSVPPALILLRR